ncbi:hypothetical protein PIB30_077988 [Stylosanthes scabra]|uniref:Zinc finger GRF-type domain-containing protein n=1 Tax=Stylosanthes scabra TaxID=79078 RepID=A0ABU6ZPG6_9FABA|nr:hypothetical protein [Stylosanthes scabra]
MESEGGSLKSRKSVGGGAAMSSESTQGVFDSRCRDDRDGVAPKCYCGGYAILYRSRTRNNPNRLFFGCPFFRDGDGAEAINDHFAVIKVEDMVALLENRVAAMEKIRNVNWWIVVANIIALLVVVYVIGS